MGEPNFDLADATELGHAMVSYLARTRGIRTLSIKGPVSAIHGLRPARVSQDIDVLIEPSRSAELIKALEEVGWYEPYSAGAPTTLASPSVTLLHDGWPASLDAHAAFSGIFADPSDAFDTLWERRVEVVLAERPVDATDRMGSICISALHSLRDPAEARSVYELDLLHDLIADSFTDEERADLLQLVTVLRSRSTMAPLLERAGFSDLGEDLTELEQNMWHLREAHEPKTLAWFLELQETPLRQWPGVVRRALLPPEDYFRVAHPETGQGRWALWRGMMRRIGHGISGIPAAVGVLIRNRKQN